MLLAGVNNERRTGALAVFPLDGFGGAAPAETPTYRCDNCPAACPEHYFVFPPAGAAAAFRGMPYVAELAVTEAQEVDVSVNHGYVRLPADVRDSIVRTNYRLDHAFKVRGAELSREYRSVYEFLFRSGRLDLPYHESAARAQLWPVLKWDGSRYAAISGPER